MTRAPSDNMRLGPVGALETHGVKPLAHGADVHGILAPVVLQIRKYDAMRRSLETSGGHLSDLDRVADILTQEIRVGGGFREHTVSLVDPAALRSALMDVGNYDIRLDVRQLDTRMPVYYVCRIRQDYYATYSLVVEDVYRSPGYPMTDERFVRLMHFGHETYYLRLSPFRERVEQMAGRNGDASRRETDDILYDLGRHVFQAAWHEDQRPGMLVATHLGLPRFRQAIELLYLCLSGELCELRSAINEKMARFFEDIYPQPAIRGFMDLLTDLEGDVINGIPQRALALYAKLSNAFGEVIREHVAWGSRHVKVPLFKLLFGNFSRLDLVAKALKNNDEVTEAANRLDKQAQQIIDELLAGPKDTESPTRP